MKSRVQTDNAAAVACGACHSNLQDLQTGRIAGPQAGLFSRFGTWAELVKINLALASTLSAATGYIICRGVVGEGIITSTLGIFLVAMGSCALNQFQDRAIDARMERTRRRPIPAGKLKPAGALAISAFFIASGLLLFWTHHGLKVALTAMIAVILYNGIYTYLKRVWAFAVVPGALIGALPPMIGWMAAGGDISDPRLMALAFFFFIWQTPHFWLLLFIVGEEYERAGLASLTSLLSLGQRVNLVFIWLLTTAAASLLLPIYRVTTSEWASLSLLVCALVLAWRAATLRRHKPEARSFRQGFRFLNVYAVLLLIILITDALTAVRVGS